MSNGDHLRERQPFADYPDPRTPEQRAKDLQAVRRQAGGFVQQQKDDSLEREMIAALQRRRADRPDLVQFDVVAGRGRGGTRRTLVVRGEMLAEASLVEREGARRMLDKLGLVWEPIDCLQGRVGRLKNADIDSSRYVDLARVVRRGGSAASVNHITPLRPIMKWGSSGVEPSAVKVALAGPGAAGPSTPIVAVIDSGITDQSRSDGWLSNVARGGNIDLLDDLPSADGLLDFGAGHGTFAAGVVQQVAPDADLRVYKALDSDGIGNEVDVACAMVQAVTEGAQILNLSLGVQTIDDQPPVAIAAALDIITEMTKGEVLVIAAAGNEGSTRPCWPAAFRQVVSVAALTADLTPADWSSRGFWVDCSTVGEGILSTYPEGVESPELDPQPDSFGADAWAVWTGTSFAAPQIAGAVARIAGERGITAREALRELLLGGRQIPDFGIGVAILPGT